MKKLSTDTTTTLADLRATVESAYAQAQEAIDNANPFLRALREAIHDYEEALIEAAGTVRDYIEARSEKWQESERADAYTTWADAIEEATAECEGADTVELGELEIPDLPELEG